MRFYTDGSRVGKKDTTGFFIGWGAVCINGVLVQNSRAGGSNINGLFIWTKWGVEGASFEALKKSL